MGNFRNFAYFRDFACFKQRFFMETRFCCYNIGQDHLQVFWKGTLSKPYSFQSSLQVSIFMLLLTFIFCLIVPNVAKLIFLESILRCIKTGQKWFYDHPVSNNGLWNFEKTYFITDFFLVKWKSSNTDFNIK